MFRLYLIEILHQTTTTEGEAAHFSSCILSKFYIKPQLNMLNLRSKKVVSYRNSTSNHNSYSREYDSKSLYLIEILHQTTTSRAAGRIHPRLYLIEILHQTTTMNSFTSVSMSLYLIEILHQTTTFCRAVLSLMRCILSKFYIKPQRRASY